MIKSKFEMLRYDYTGNNIEPVEDLSIIQEDGSRACYNWECYDGFQIVNLDLDSSKIGISNNDPGALYLKSRE